MDGISYCILFFQMDCRVRCVRDGLLGGGERRRKNHVEAILLSSDCVVLCCVVRGGRLPCVSFVSSKSVQSV